MRIWSLHPKYLDSKGLVALWREGLLAKNVLLGNTKGYKNHPQLSRFKKSISPVDGINHYLSEVYNEALERDYNFNRQKVEWGFKTQTLKVNNGQIDYEINHLLRKLKTRDRIRFNQLKSLKRYEIHPIFSIVDGEVEEWEIVG